MCGVAFWTLAVIITGYQTYRGYCFQMIRNDEPFGRWSNARRRVLLALADGFFYFVTTASGFVALGAAAKLFAEIGSSKQAAEIGGGTTALLIFLLLYGILGVTAQLPPLIHQGKFLPRLGSP